MQYGMDKFSKKLMRQQLDDKLNPLKDFTMPTVGWIKIIRTALGLTTAQLAKKCGLSKQRISRIERDEKLKKTSLETLEKVAAQLECKFIYAFVPIESVEKIIEKQARKKALEKLKLISHSMALEGQALSNQSNKKQLALLTEELITNKIKEIWD